MKRGRVIQVRATGLDETGAGLCAYAYQAPGSDDQAGRAIQVHVADLLPGERARVRIEHVSPHGRMRAWARIEERLGEACAERVAPACPASGQCGGCAWQHLAYSAQLEHKRQRVVAAFADAGLELDDARVMDIRPAPQTLGYRNVGKYVVGRAPSGAIVLGSYAPRSHRIVDSAGCRVVAPVIERVRERVRAFIQASPWPEYNERARRGVWRHVVVRQGFDDRVLVALVTMSGADDGPTRDDLTRELERHGLARDPEIAGVVWLASPATSGTILAGEHHVLCGASHTRERLAPGLELALDIRDFFQVNREEAARMHHEVIRLARLDDMPTGRDARILDLYCGAGAIGLQLAHACKERGVRARVLGVERNPSAVRAARSAADGAALQAHASFTVADAAEAARIGQELGGPPDLVVVNPPRKGLSQDARAALVALSPTRLIYVSCSPESLARDLVALCAPGQPFEIDAQSDIHIVDLMPGTPHIETLVALRRARTESESD